MFFNCCAILTTGLKNIGAYHIKKKQSQIVYSSRLEPFVAFLQNAIDSDITPHSKLE